MLTIYSKISERKVNGHKVEAWQTSKSDDPTWDNFLLAIPFAHFEQTSMWAKAKETQGWMPLRIIFTIDQKIIGGIQILYKSKYIFFKFGYALKGPVINKPNNSLSEYIFHILKRRIQKMGITALVIQPPFSGNIYSKLFKNAGALPIYSKYLVKDATVIVDVTKKIDEILAGMKASKRRNIRKGIRKKITIRQGSKNDLSIFYKLMLKTCQRKGVYPNPNSFYLLQKIWDAFDCKGCIKLFFSCYKGADIAGLITIIYGKVVYIWKVGWSGEHGLFRPNDVLYWEVFKWAKNNGFSYVDLFTINPDASEIIKKGQRLKKELAYSSASFKIDFGGEVFFYPNSYAYFPHFLTRWLYKLSLKYYFMNKN